MEKNTHFYTADSHTGCLARSVLETGETNEVRILELSAVRTTRLLRHACNPPLDHKPRSSVREVAALSRLLNAVGSRQKSQQRFVKAIEA
jgi:hypothetical protein